MAIESTSSASFVNRMIRAAKLEVPLYEEVEADLTATNQALMVVVLVAVASGIGQAGSGRNAIAGILFGLVTALIGWAVWSYVMYFVGTRFMGGTATYGELLRTLGFAESPGVLFIFGIIPGLGGLIRAIAGIWVLVTSFIAIRQALDIDNGKTVITIVIGIVALVVVYAIIGIIFGVIFGLGVLVGSAL
jgi:hypothetical protein